MKPRIGILGCGWLGFPLGRQLISLGFPVSGTTTTKANLQVLRDEGIEAFYVELFRDGVKGHLIEFLNEVEILIIDIPPERKKEKGDYTGKMEQLYEACRITHIQKILFVSSTSVYGNLQGEVTEKTEPRPVSESAKALVEAEALFSKDPTMSCTVVRFGGLIGPDRHPVTYLAGQQNLTNGDDFVNLIHLDDCLSLLCAVIEKEWWGKIINGVYPEHPKKRDYYTREAHLRGLAAPVYKKEYAGKSGKYIKSRTLESLGFAFKTHIDHPIE
ncbi:Nucleoside-diphosphate-sugar epimerase [Muriicola jejuensis]|uniref:NAD(P)H-binding protein n=1 Tax=Muriicola jejuensis TaxID=504488 RepID=A0A6P0U921_9FLAO|nr:SDR family oxidoreductase [Muriicola jejuensis]NER09685.1 NAD(P)H-binding protein [Muriicola jejuensis]SMP06660.1 Nucleoside-diphosphate-sugar epimerase [Muriicola jejuensis]